MASASQPTSKPSISLRKHFRWLPDGLASEPTSTIVLTSQSNYYVDTRILKPTHIEPALETPDPKVSLPISRLDWAFGGTSASQLHARRQSSGSGSGRKDKLKALTPANLDSSKAAQGSGSGSKEKLEELSELIATNPESSKAQASTTENLDQLNVQASSSTSSLAEAGPSGPHHKRKPSGPANKTTTWDHWVDTRHSKGTRVSLGNLKLSNASSSFDGSTDEWTDIGTIYPTDRDNETIEKGRMRNPDTGLMTEYEELWKDLPLQKVPYEPGFLSFVMKAENKILGTRGIIIRVGNWCQGVIRSGNDLAVERWRFGPSAVFGGTGESGLLGDESPIGSMDGGILGSMKWERLAKIGEMSLPCQVSWEKGWELGVGEEVISGGLAWEIVEKVYWKE